MESIARSPRAIATDAFAINASTNRDLSKTIKGGRFREDLYFRLKVVLIRPPPLREGREDIPPLTDHILIDASQRFNRPALRFENAGRTFSAWIYCLGGIGRLMRLVITAASSAGSTGLATCIWKPAFKARTRSSTCP